MNGDVGRPIRCRGNPSLKPETIQYVKARRCERADCLPQVLVGVMVVTDISLVGWLVSSAESVPAHKAWGAVVAVIVITLAGFRVHRQIERHIDALEGL